MITRYILR